MKRWVSSDFLKGFSDSSTKKLNFKLKQKRGRVKGLNTRGPWAMEGRIPCFQLDKSYIFNYVYMHVYLHVGIVTCVHRCLQRSEDAIRSPGAEYTGKVGSYLLRTQVLWKSRTCSKPISHLWNLQTDVSVSLFFNVIWIGLWKYFRLKNPKEPWHKIHVNIWPQRKVRKCCTGHSRVNGQN